MTFQTILTDIGSQKIADAVANSGTIQILTGALGDGGGAPTTPDPSDTALVNETSARVSINQISAVGDQITVEFIIPTTDGGYEIREAAVFDADGDMILVANISGGYKPAPGEGGLKQLVMRMVATVQSAAVINVTVDDSTVIATREWVLDQINGQGSHTIASYAVAAGQTIVPVVASTGFGNRLYFLSNVPLFIQKGELSTNADGSIITLTNAPINDTELVVVTLFSQPIGSFDMANGTYRGGSAEAAMDARVETIGTLSQLKLLGTGLAAGDQKIYQNITYTLNNDIDYTALIAADNVGYFIETTFSATAAWVGDISGGLNLQKFGWDRVGLVDASTAMSKAIAVQHILHSDGYGIDIDGGDLLLSAVVDIDNGVHPALNFTGNTNIVVDNAIAGFRIGNTAAAQLDISGQHPVFTQSGTGTGVGILAIRGGFNLPGLRGFGTNNWILDCQAAAANAITNSTVDNVKLTNCGGIRAVNPTRGSLELIVRDVHASNIVTQVVNFENITDAMITELIGDTDAAFAGAAVRIHNCGGIHTGSMSVTARNGMPYEFTGNTDADNDTTSGCHFGELHSFASSQEAYLNTKRCHYGTIHSKQAKSKGLRLGTFFEDNHINSIQLYDGSVTTPSQAFDNDSLYPNSIDSFSSESADDTYALDISSGGNQLSMGVLVRSVAATGVWANGNRPKSLNDSRAPAFVYKGGAANVVITGTGAGPFNIPHGLVGTPSRYSVNCNNQTIAFQVTANSTNLQVTFASSVTDPSFTWNARMF